MPLDDLGGTVGFTGNWNYGFTNVRRVSTGHYCITLEPDLRQYLNILTINVSGLRHAGGGAFTGSPLAYQELPSDPCQALETEVVTEILNDGMTTPSNQVAFAITAN